MEANNFFFVKSPDRHKFFRSWVEMLTPWHNLTAREKDVLARIMEQYFIIREKTTDEALATELLWTNSSRKDMRESLGMERAHFQMVLARLRESGVLNGEVLEPRYLPHLTEQPRLGLYVVFDWSTASNPVNGEK